MTGKEPNRPGRSLVVAAVGLLSIWGLCAVAPLFSTYPMGECHDWGADPARRYLQNRELIGTCITVWQVVVASVAASVLWSAVAVVYSAIRSVLAVQEAQDE